MRYAFIAPAFISGLLILEDKKKFVLVTSCIIVASCLNYKIRLALGIDVIHPKMSEFSAWE